MVSSNLENPRFETVQSYCYWYHLWLFYWLIQGTMSHWVTFYERPLFVWNFCQNVVGPSIEYVVFVHHLMLLQHIHCHRMACNQNLSGMIQHHCRHLALHHCLESYSVIFRYQIALNQFNQLKFMISGVCDSTYHLVIYELIQSKCYVLELYCNNTTNIEWTKNLK